MSEQEPEDDGTLAWKILGAVALVVGVLLVWTALSHQASGGPPPPTPLPRSVLAHAAPAPSTLPAPTTEAQIPRDAKRRREARETAAATAAADEPKKPHLRVAQVGISPWKISKHARVGHDPSRPGDLRIAATYRGRKVRAHVVIDGVYRGESPLDLNLPNGDHTIRIDYGATRVNEFTAHIEGGGRETLAVELRRPDQIGHNPAAKGSRGYHE